MKPKIKELIEKATPGPWSVENLRHHKHAINASSWDELATVYGNYDEEYLHKQGAANAALIARCNPATMRRVIEAIEAMLANGDFTYASDVRKQGERALAALDGEGE